MMATTPHPSAGTQRTAIYAMAAIVLVLTGCATALMMTGHGIGDLLALFAVAGSPVVAYLGGLIVERVGQVKDQVNGRLSQLQDAVIALASAQAAADQKEQKT